MKKLLGLLLAATMVFAMVSCSEDEQIIIYSNADDEAAVAAKKALDENGFEGKYIFQSFGTSELGGKLLAEGKDIEADLITMSSFYIESAQSLWDKKRAELLKQNEPKKQTIPNQEASKKNAKQKM